MNVPLFHFETVETPIRCVKIRFEKTFSARDTSGATTDPLLVFEDFANKHLAKGYSHFHLDLRHLPFPSTRFIAVLIALTVRARRRHGEVTLSHVTDTARNNFVTFSALSYLTLEPTAESAQIQVPDAPHAPTPAPSQKRTTAAGAKGASAHKPLPSVAPASPSAFHPHVVDLPAATFGVDGNDGLSPVPTASPHPTGTNLPLENSILTEEVTALADIVDPPLVKEITEKIETPVAPGDVKSFQIRVESRASNLYQLCDFVTVHAAQAGINEKEIGKIKIAVYEACLNVIEHAYHSRPDEWIEIEVGYSPDKFTIFIVDHGLSFEMKPPTAYDVQEVMDKRRSGGFGLHIIRRSMDNVEYHPDLVNGNRLIMVKHLK